MARQAALLLSASAAVCARMLGRGRSDSAPARSRLLLATVASAKHRFSCFMRRVRRCPAAPRALHPARRRPSTFSPTAGRQALRALQSCGTRSRPPSIVQRRAELVSTPPSQFLERTAGQRVHRKERLQGGSAGRRRAPGPRPISSGAVLDLDLLLRDGVPVLRLGLEFEVVAQISQ